jgi:hypothetical protein
MALIKSAVEIALEKTEAVQVDKEALEADRARKDGKMVASKFLGEGEFSLKEALAGKDAKVTRWMREGVVEALLANIVLPQDAFAAKRVKRVAEAFAAIGKSDRRLQQIFTQLEGFFQEYTEERERLREMVNKQYEPVRKQKEAELSQRMGQQVRIDPAADPDYVSSLRRAMTTVEDRYGGVLEKVRGEVMALVADR